MSALGVVLKVVLAQGSTKVIVKGEYTTGVAVVEGFALILRLRTPSVVLLVVKVDIVVPLREMIEE